MTARTRFVQLALEQIVVYGLFDPRDGEIRYVGKASDLGARLRAHLKPSSLRRETHKNKWLRTVLASGGKPSAHAIQAFDNERDALAAEVHWIASLRAAGCRLTNGTDGGEGTAGRVLSVQSRAKMSVSQRKRTATAETKARMSAAQVGRPVATPQTRAKISAALTGVSKSKLSIEKMLATRGLLFATPAMRLKLSRSQGGRPFVDDVGRKYETLYDAVSDTGVDRSSICAVLKGRRKTAGGYAFAYVSA